MSLNKKGSGMKNMKLAYSMYSKATVWKIAHGLGKTLKSTTLDQISAVQLEH